jgi:hypothetical protein
LPSSLALLTVLSWREVVMLNVVPGLLMSLTLPGFLGTPRLGRKPAARQEGGE